MVLQICLYTTICQIRFEKAHGEKFNPIDFCSMRSHLNTANMNKIS
jgi:hypothetical protein